jgi:alpha-tubulin suppressor-like RCC1 family protein
VCAGLLCGCVQRCEDGFYWKTDGTFHGDLSLTNADGSPRTSATSLAFGYSNDTACIVAADATVWCQGSNDDGQLGAGDATTLRNSQLVQVLKGEAPSGAPLTGIKKVASADGAFFCALGSDGGLWCWGADTWGELGTGSTRKSSFATPVLDAPGGSPIANVADVVVGQAYACLLKLDGTVWCWGFNGYGDVGTGAAEGSANRNPAKVLAISEPVTGIFASAYHETSTTCAIDATRSVWCWGYQAGPDGDPETNLAPVRLTMSKGGAAFADALQIDATNRRVRKSDGTLWDWDSTSVTPLTENNIPVTGSFYLGRGCWIGADGVPRGIGERVTCP